MAASGLQRRKIEVLLDQVDQLPTLPGVAHHLLPLLVAPSPSRRDIQFAIEVDASLSARAVKLAIDLGRPAESVRSIDAVFRSVPLEALAGDLLSLEVMDESTLRDLHMAKLWRHGLAVAIASQVIASRLGTVSPEEAQLAGLLHHIGQIALATVMPKAYAQVLEKNESSGGDLLEQEREVFGVDHPVLGKRLLQRWGFAMSLQNVVWLHRQAVAPAAEHGSGTLLPQVVRLADILVRQQGFAYPPWESVTESATEAAERLGLSNASAEQIAHQVVEVFEMNAQPTGLLDEPSKADLWPTLAVANAHLGRRYRAARAGEQASQVQANRAELLITLNGRLATCTSARDVLQTVAATARESLELRVVVPYLVGREKDYVEGILATPDTAGEHFLYAINSHEGIETLMPDAVAATLLTVPTRAERIEDWLFERQGPRLGEGPFFTVPMIVEGAKVGGIVFAFHGPARDLTARESAALTALAGMAGVALKRVQAEADLVMLTEELAEVNRELQAAQDERVRQRNVASMGEMAAGAAHEINNPLAIISGRAQQLAGTEQDPAGREMLRTIIQQAQRISDIIADLHLFARPPVPDLRTVDPIELAQQVADEMAAEGTPAQLRVDAPEPVPAIWVDPQQVAAALKEIVRNAVEACSNGYGGEVTISVQAAAGEAAVRLAVIDSGPGMAPEVRARALDPFYCGHKAGRHRGLGLPKAYRAVQANGGQMAMESAPGRGTTVRMIFPVAAGKS